eukprot:Gb_27367 [translate_table: standard]
MLKKQHTRLEYFKQNGSIQLPNYIASKGGRVIAKIFYAEEIEKATNNFSDDMKLGSGGYGAVYEGALLDGTLVAIKKSINVDDQFINEVIILTQINHRYVVKLLGCCLETNLHYCFGVVLVELLTGLKPLSWERVGDEFDLSSLFLSRMKKGRLTEILDPKLAILGDEQDMKSMEYVGKLAKECLQAEGERRPSMKEVVEELRSDKYVEKGEAEAYPCGEFVSEGPSTRSQTYTTYTSGVQLVNMSGR